MLRIGCHLSSSKGFFHMGKEAVKIGANTFQFFTRNPRGSRAKEIDPEDVRKFLEYAQEHDICQILAHAPYTLNPCSKDAKTREFAWMTMEDDLKRMEYVPGNCYNFHPGSHVGQGAQEGIRMISEMLNQILKEEQHTTVLLETMAGKGTEVGRSFEELAQILDRVELKSHMGVCLDTCHVYDAGYDLVGQLDQVLEEFDRVNGRYTYLTGQRDDVEKAKEELTGVIDEITRQMTEIFAQQFRLLNESFQETFLELFGGGKARLELEDENDILGCGIEIKVQPPGKQLKTITLLSGGEKAFVAIALYFAIMKVHPTPFCVMDEIEAALDEANVVRYARYMRRIAGKTQFIVITHRRGTMEEADVLYGVTMQERGVSRILTINLNDMAKELKIK